MSNIKLMSKTQVPSQRYMTTLGELRAFNELGQAMVCIDNGDTVHARIAVNGSDIDDSIELPVQVVLLFDVLAKEVPVITAIVRDSLIIKEDIAEEQVKNCVDDVYIDGKRIVFEGRDEITLKCGKSSIVMHRDGKLVIKGTNLISRSSGANKLKGSSVNIN